MTPLPRSTSALPASNCGLTSSTSSPCGVHAAISCGSTRMIEMNDRSATTRSTAPPMAVGGQVADVKPLEHGHPLVVADLRVQLPVTDIDGNDVRWRHVAADNR